VSLSAFVPPAHGHLDLIDLSEQARPCLDAHAASGAHLDLECELAIELPLALAAPSVVSSLAIRLVRRAVEVIGDDWGSVCVATGISGMGRSTFARRSALADQKLRHHVYLEVHSTGPVVGPLESGFATQPFSARGFEPLELEKATELLREFGGDIVLDPFATAGVSALLLLPFAAADLPW